MENMERFTPSYVIAYAITNSMQNLRFDKEDYFHVLVFYTGYFIKEIETTSTRVSITVCKHGKWFLFLQRRLPTFFSSAPAIMFLLIS